MSARRQFCDVHTSLVYASSGHVAASLSSPLDEFTCQPPRILVQLKLFSPNIEDSCNSNQKNNVFFAQALVR
jgi:hypothetical protein